MLGSNEISLVSNREDLRALSLYTGHKSRQAVELNGADQQIEELYGEEQTIIGIDPLTDELTNSQRPPPPSSPVPNPRHRLLQQLNARAHY
jgi:hypothetical protein